MTKRNNSSPEGKRLRALAAKTREQKEKFLEQLRKYPIVQTAADKTGVGRSTYYAWRNRDEGFAQAAHQAIKESIAFVSDMAESQLVRSIQNGNMTGIIFWLKSRHSAYVDRRHYEHEHEIVPRKFNEKQQKMITKALTNIGLANVIKWQKLKSEEFKKASQGVPDALDSYDESRHPLEDENNTDSEEGRGLRPDRSRPRKG